MSSWIFFFPHLFQSRFINRHSRREALLLLSVALRTVVGLDSALVVRQGLSRVGVGWHCVSIAARPRYTCSFVTTAQFARALPACARRLLSLSGRGGSGGAHRAVLPSWHFPLRRTEAPKAGNNDDRLQRNSADVPISAKMWEARFSECERIRGSRVLWESPPDVGEAVCGLGAANGEECEAITPRSARTLTTDTAGSQPRERDVPSAKMCARVQTNFV